MKPKRNNGVKSIITKMNISVVTSKADLQAEEKIGSLKDRKWKLTSIKSSRRMNIA
jgi:hypothetical protein